MRVPEFHPGPEHDYDEQARHHSLNRPHGASRLEDYGMGWYLGSVARVHCGEPAFDEPDRVEQNLEVRPFQNRSSFPELECQHQELAAEG